MSRNFREIFDKFKLKMLPPLANSVEICGVPRFPNAESTINHEATIKINYPGKKRASLFYKIRESFEDERLQPLPRSAGAEKFDCLEFDGVKFYQPEPLLIQIHVVAHGSVLDTIANILNHKVDQPYLRTFSVTELKLTEKFCQDITEWMAITGIMFGKVEYTRCKINCEARLFSPLITALKEIKMNDCKCTFGSPNLFEGVEFKKRISKMEKLYLKPFVTSQRFHAANDVIDMALFEEREREVAEEQDRAGPLEAPEPIERPERQHAPLPRVFANVENDEEAVAWPRFPFRGGMMNPGEIPHFPVEPVGADGFDFEEEDILDDEPWPAVDVDGAERRFGQLDLAPVDLEIIRRQLFGIRRNDRADEPENDPDDENEVNPFMNLGGPELLSTIATEIFWGSHSTLNEHDAVKFVKEIVDGSRVIKKFTLDHRNLAMDRALRRFCKDNMEKIQRYHYTFKAPNGKKYYIHRGKAIFKIQNFRFK